MDLQLPSAIPGKVSAEMNTLLLSGAQEII
jgi:hypothetical protein